MANNHDTTSPAIAVDDVEPTDPTLADDLASSTASVSSSIYNYRQENGRTYHAFKDGKYALPNDEEESDRLDLQHNLFILSFDNKLGFAPPNHADAKVNNVLDIEPTHFGHAITMIVGGNKYACEACVRGHRVSNCQHVDRPLQQISRKGRPISQCQHCRVMRKSRSAHIKCDCGAQARNMMLEKQSGEGNKESCSCNEGGRCTCAYKKELPRMGAVPGGDSDKDSKTSARSNGGRRRAEEHCHNQVPADDAKQSQKTGPSELNHARPTHSNTNLHNGSPNNILPWTSGGFPNGSLEGHGSHQEQGWVTTGTASAFLHSTPASSIIHEFDNQLPILDLSTTIDSNFELFGDLLDAEQHKVNAWQSAINGDWRTHEFSTEAGYYQAQRFNSLDSCGSQQPTLSNTITSTSARVPLTATMDATAGDWWLTMPSLSGPDICAAPPASDVALNITHISSVAVPSKAIPNQPLISDTQHQMTPTHGIMSVTSSDRQSAPWEARELEGDNSHFWG